MRRSLALLSLVCSVSLAGATTPCSAALDSASRALVEGTNKIGFEMFPLVYDEAVSRDKNILFSPFSLSMALHLALNGAVGPALIELRQFMGVANFDLDAINTGFAKLVANLNDLPGKEKLRIANSAWADQSRYQFSSHFKIPAEFHSVDFNDPSSVGLINQWVKEKTEGMIPSAVAELPPNALAVLINALFFQAPWQYSFAKAPAQKFTDRDGTVVQAEMMRSRIAARPYLDSDAFQIVSLDFAADNGQGPETSRFALDILLPKKSSASDTIDHFAKLQFARGYPDILAKMRLEHIDLTLPKFKASFGKNLVQALRRVGLKYIFDSRRDSFANMGKSLNSEILALDSVLQKVAVEADEKGFKAAAVTSMTFFTTTSIPEPDVTMVVDRPFLFFLRDRETGLILFEGAITDPTLVD